MDLFVVFSLFLLLCGSNTCHMAFLNEEDEFIDTQEKAQYYLEQLQKSISRISLLQKRLLRTKRDLIAAQSDRKTDFLFNSVLNFCNQIQDFNTNDPTIATDTESSTARSNAVDDPKYENWIQPAVRPTHVHAVRHGEKTVGIKFDVIKSTPFVITRIAGFEVEKREVPKGNGSTDKLGFKIDTSKYCEGEEYEIENRFHFEPKGRPDDFVNLRINVCKFDKFQDESVPWENRKWETRYGPRDENIKMPKFRIDSNITNEIVLIPGKNVSFEMTVQMDRRSHMSLHAVLYDRKAKKLISNSFSYNLNMRNYASPRKSKDRELLMVDFLHSSVVKNASESEERSYEDSEIEEIKSRVTLITESGFLTGKLFISSSDRFGDYYSPTVVSSAHLGREIKIKKPNKRKVFPRRKALFIANGPFFCDHEGNKGHERSGRNCTVVCEAIGRGIISLTISKKDSDIPISRSITLRWTEHLSTIIDVGPASPDIEGTYTCTVAGAKGNYQQSQEIQLFTSGFPKIDVNETTVIAVQNARSMIKCVILGRLPITVRIEVSVETEWISLTDRNLSVQRDMEDGRGTVVTIELSTEELRYPAGLLSFDASNDLGHDHHSINLEEVIPDHRGEAKPVPEESKIFNLGNGTTAITCTATGRRPLTIWITNRGTNEHNRIDNEAKYIRVERQTENGKSVTLFANTKSLNREYRLLYCVARNDYGVANIKLKRSFYINQDLRINSRP